MACGCRFSFLRSSSCRLPQYEPPQGPLGIENILKTQREPVCHDPWQLVPGMTITDQGLQLMQHEEWSPGGLGVWGPGRRVVRRQVLGAHPAEKSLSEFRRKSTVCFEQEAREQRASPRANSPAEKWFTTLCSQALKRNEKEKAGAGWGWGMSLLHCNSLS